MLDLKFGPGKGGGYVAGYTWDITEWLRKLKFW